MGLSCQEMASRSSKRRSSLHQEVKNRGIWENVGGIWGPLVDMWLTHANYCKLMVIHWNLLNMLDTLGPLGPFGIFGNFGVQCL